MTMESPSDLPVTRDIRLIYVFSLIIALIMAAAAVLGLLYQTRIYPMEEMRAFRVPADIVTLTAGLPILLGSMWLTRRGNLIGLLCWPGALCYVLYMYILYLIGVPFGVLFPAYLLIVTFTVYTLIGLLASIDGEAVCQRLDGRVPAKAAGIVLITLSVLFGLREIGMIISTITGQIPLNELEVPLWISDFVVLCGTWLIGGVLLLQRKAFGYVAGAGLLLVGAVLFFGLAFVVIYPAFSGAALGNIVPDMLMLFIPGLACLIPFALFVRGMVAKRRLSPA